MTNVAMSVGLSARDGFAYQAIQQPNTYFSGPWWMELGYKF